MVELKAQPLNFEVFHQGQAHYFKIFEFYDTSMKLLKAHIFKLAFGELENDSVDFFLNTY